MEEEALKQGVWEGVRKRKEVEQHTPEAIGMLHNKLAFPVTVSTYFFFSQLQLKRSAPGRQPTTARRLC